MKDKPKKLSKFAELQRDYDGYVHDRRYPVTFLPEEDLKFEFLLKKIAELQEKIDP